jgi:hypothetical protein
VSERTSTFRDIEPRNLLEICRLSACFGDICRKTSAADAGSARVGRHGPDRKPRSLEVIMLRAAERTSSNEWAVLGSNQ